MDACHLADVYGARFTSAPLLVLCNRCFSLVVGLALSLAVPSQSSDSRTRTNGKALPAASSRPLDRLRPKSPLYAYAAVAVFNFAATFCQYEALRHVSFTTQTLAKCSKMVSPRMGPCRRHTEQKPIGVGCCKLHERLIRQPG